MSYDNQELQALIQHHELELSNALERLSKHFKDPDFNPSDKDSLNRYVSIMAICCSNIVNHYDLRKSCISKLLINEATHP